MAARSTHYDKLFMISELKNNILKCDITVMYICSDSDVLTYIICLN